MSVAVLRFGIFAALLIAFAVIERRFPHRRWRTVIRDRWQTHAVLGTLGLLVPALLTRVLPILAGVGAAQWAQASGIGLLRIVTLPPPVTIVVAVLLLDMAIYGQHRAMHRWALLWRFHAVHHHDHDLDVTTALRFHPGEIFLSTLYKAAAAAVIGAPVEAVVIHETLLSSMALFNHANIALPPRVERWVRMIIVTPTMHVRHHSTRRAEHDSNYGNMLSVWDHLFGSYCPEPAEPRPFAIGLADTQDRPVTGLAWLLVLPGR